MSAQAKRGALIAGIIMIAIGLLFFVENWYSQLSAWRLIARYWPLILIFIGVRKIYRYFTWQEFPQAPGIPPKE